MAHLCLSLAPMLLAAEARLHLHSLSLRMHAATNGETRLEFTTVSALDSALLNGELAPLPQSAAGTHGSFYKLSGGALPEPVFGTIFLNVPVQADANTNGVPDFYEVALEVPVTATTGTYEDFERQGSVAATWKRPAGAAAGTCQIDLAGYGLAFTNTFEILAFEGAFNYRNIDTEPNITATVQLDRQGDAAKKLSGVMTLKKVALDKLQLISGALADEAGRPLQHGGANELARVRSDYFADLFFEDGDASSSRADYIAWRLKITEPRDSNGNGIPDLSDAGGPRPPPALSLALRNGALFLRISGELGKAHHVETIGELGGPRWTLETTVTLTSDPQEVSLPIPSNRARTGYWRVRVP